MNFLKSTLLSTAAFAAMAMLLPASRTTAADEKSKLSNADERFIQNEAAAGAAEVTMAKLATEKASREDVRAFAGMLVTDHTKANEELAKLASDKGVELATGNDDKHAKKHEQLAQASGAEFDKAFLAMAVTSHEKCVRNFTEASTDAEDPEVKAWAAKTLPTLKAHLEKAKALSSGSAAKTNGQGGTTTAPNDTTTAPGGSNRGTPSNN